MFIKLATPEILASASIFGLLQESLCFLARLVQNSAQLWENGSFSNSIFQFPSRQLRPLRCTSNAPGAQGAAMRRPRTTSVTSVTASVAAASATAGAGVAWMERSSAETSWEKRCLKFQAVLILSLWSFEGKSKDEGKLLRQIALKLHFEAFTFLFTYESSGTSLHLLIAVIQLLQHGSSFLTPPKFKQGFRTPGNGMGSVLTTQLPQTQST